MISYKICPLCNRQVLKGQAVTIIINFLKCTSNSGDYELSSEFFDKEQVLHATCVMEKYPSLLEERNEKGEINEYLMWATFNDLDSIGEKVTIEAVRDLMIRFPSATTSQELLTKWFQSRE